MLHVTNYQTGDTGYTPLSQAVGQFCGGGVNGMGKERIVNLRISRDKFSHK